MKSRAEELADAIAQELHNNPIEVVAHAVMLSWVAVLSQCKTQAMAAEYQHNFVTSVEAAFSIETGKPKEKRRILS